MPQTTRRSLAAEDLPLAKKIGGRLRAARLQRGLTQQQLAEGRYTKAYVSALETGLIKPSMAALNFMAERLGTSASALLADDEPTWSRLEADLRLASGDWQAAADAYESLLANSERAQGRAELLRGLAEALYRLDKPDAAVTAASEAASVFQELGSQADAALARYWVAAAHHEADRPGQAREVIEGLLSQVRAGLEVPPDFRIRLLIGTATAAGHAGHPQVALGYLQEARGLADELDDQRRGSFLFALALSYRSVNDVEAAVRTGLQSLALFRAAEAEVEIASIENELALSYLALGNVPKARSFAKNAHEQFELLADERFLAHVLETEAQVELAAEEMERAARLAQEAVELARRVGNAKAELSALLTWARVLRRQGAADEAARRLEEAAAMARRLGRTSALRETLREWADVLAQQGDIAGAYRLSREALSA